MHSVLTNIERRYPKIINLFLGGVLLGITTSVDAGLENAALRLEVVSPLKRVFQSTAVIEQKDPKIELWAARNEYESAQVALQANGLTTINKVEASDLINAGGNVISASMFEYRFPAYVPLKKHTVSTPVGEVEGDVPGYFPDPFEESASLKFRDTRSLWMTLYISPDTPPGDYRGELIVSTETGIRRVPMLVHVWAFTLPVKPSLYVTNWIYLHYIESQYGTRRGSKVFWNVIEEIARDVTKHRQNVVFTPLSLIKSIEHRDGSYSFDFGDYEKWVEIFKRHGVQAFEGSHLFHEKNSYNIRRHSGGQMAFGEQQLATQEGKVFLKSLLQALYQENMKLGIQDIYLQHIADEASYEQMPLYREIGVLVREAMPGVLIVDASELDADKRSAMMDIPVTKVGKAMAEPSQRAKEKWGRWWYTATTPRGKFPNRFIDYPLVKMRMIPWVSWRYSMSGYLHCGYNYWGSDSGKSPWLEVDQAKGYPPGDGFVVYPPRSGRSSAPVSSLRWETFRDGLEDYEYLSLLETWSRAGSSPLKSACNGQRREATALLAESRAAVASAEDYPREAQTVERMRRRMGATLDGLSRCMEKN